MYNKIINQHEQTACSEDINEPKYETIANKLFSSFFFIHSEYAK